MQNDVQSSDRGQAGVNEKRPVSQYASPHEIFYFRLGEELYKRNIPFLNDVLRQLLTTSVSLMGGGIVFLSDALCNKGCKVAAITMFLLATLSALGGVLPYRDDLPLSMPYAIKAGVERAIWWKDGFVYTASIFIVLGLGLAFAGVLLK